ncbi:MAG: alanine:cation symporter family protein [Muribaculaceae bacterium]|nr:alanine:cation symporter family protein [Muribaculaceae bacterium]
MGAIDAINDFLWSYVLIAVLLGGGLYFTLRTRCVQLRMLPDMLRALAASGSRHGKGIAGRSVSSFQAFAISLASRVGTGNIAGVAIAIALGGPGAVFWMWVVAVLGSANAFVESTLAQLFKVRGEHSFRGGPAYYISMGLGNRPWAVLFAVLITLTFAIAFNSVQCNTMALALERSFDIPPVWTGVVTAALTLAVICGGVRRIAVVNQIVVPLMAGLYILLACYVVATRAHMFPHVMRLILDNAFGIGPAVGGGMGIAVVMGVKRGLFSNEAGEGSTPNAAATADVSHPVKQGLVQTLGVYVDTLLVCTATAFIILCSGVFDCGLTGIELTQSALETEVGSAAALFVAVAVVLFAFTSIIANYYYGETNLAFIRNDRRLIPVLRCATALMVLTGAVLPLNLVWALADITMALMTLCNMLAILLLGRYALRCLDDYTRQRREGRDPVYRASTCPDISDHTPCWPEAQD